MRPAFGSAGLIAAALGCWICAETPAVAQGLGGAARGAVIGGAVGGQGGAARGAALGAVAGGNPAQTAAGGAVRDAVAGQALGGSGAAGAAVGAMRGGSRRFPTGY